jgi:streptomycin 6-kinase
MSNFQSNIISIYGEKGQQWLDNLPQTIEKLAQEFGLTDIKTGMKDVPLSFNYIFFAKYQGIDAVVKVSPESKDSMREAQALKHFSGLGMTKLLAYDDTTIIMERAVPGMILAKDDSVSLEIACTVMKKLHSASTDFDKSYFMDIEERLKPIDQTSDFMQDMLQKARAYKQELLPKYTKRILLHGDLHHDNILKHGDSYIAIDPKGVIGDPINEAWCYVIDYEKDTKFIAEYFGFNLEDLRKWYFVHVVLAICWCLEDNINPERFLKIAERIMLRQSL